MGDYNGAIINQGYPFMTLPSSTDNFEVQYQMGMAKISTPGQKNPKQMLLLGIWLIYWLLILTLIFFIGRQAVIAILEGKINFFTIIVCVALFFGTLLWGMRGVIAAYLLFWQIAGLETLTISHNTLKVTKTIFGIGKTKEYERDEITRIELGDAKIIPLAFTKFKFTSFKLAITGSILLNSEGRKTEYLGLGLEPNQAEEIILIIQKQLFPDRS